MDKNNVEMADRRGQQTAPPHSDQIVDSEGSDSEQEFSIRDCTMVKSLR